MVNGGFGKLATMVGAGAIILGAAVGYGTLAGEVKTNKEAIIDLRVVVMGAMGNAGASAAGAALLGRLDMINDKLDRIQKQLDRLENRAH